jgi:hypothetical protein
LLFIIIYIFLCRNNSISVEHQPSSNATATTAATTAPSTHQPTSNNKQPIAATLVGTLRRKNPFNRAPINTTDFAISPTSMEPQQKQEELPISPTVPPKSTLRPISHILQHNKIDPSEDDDTEIEIIESSPRKSNKSATLRMSIRLPNAFRHTNKESSSDATNDAAAGGTVSSKKFGFTLGSNARKQRKQLDLSLFQTEQQAAEKPTAKSCIVFGANNDSDLQLNNKSTITNVSSIATNGLLPPPTLSDGSTLSSSSSTCSSTHSSYYSPVVSSKGGVPPNIKTAVKQQPPPQTPRRSSQVSFKSMDRRGSNTTIAQAQHRPTTPSLLSNSSTINSPTVPTASSSSNNNNSIPSQPAKASWLNNLFFFKQPKVCSLVVYSTHTAGILRSLHRLMNKVSLSEFF